MFDSHESKKYSRLCLTVAYSENVMSDKIFNNVKYYINKLMHLFILSELHFNLYIFPIIYIDLIMLFLFTCLFQHLQYFKLSKVVNKSI